MTSSTSSTSSQPSSVRRTADVRLRGLTGPLLATAYWPAAPPGRPPPLLVLISAGVGDIEADQAGRLCAQTGIVVLALSMSTDTSTAARDAVPARTGDDAVTAAGWAADHAAELGADPDQLLIGGVGPGATMALAAALQASHCGWPPLRRLVLIDPELEAVPARLTGIPSITVLGLATNAVDLLRAAGADVTRHSPTGLSPTAMALSNSAAAGESEIRSR